MQFGFTALIKASHLGHHKVVKVLLAAHANVEAKEGRVSASKTDQERDVHAMMELMLLAGYTDSMTRVCMRSVLHSLVLEVENGACCSLLMHPSIQY